jgi:hypothetical protein
VAQVPELTKNKAIKFITLSTAAFFTIFGAIGAQVILVSKSYKIEQIWLDNIKKCGDELKP